MATPQATSKRGHRIITVTISHGGAPKVDLDPVEISESRGDQIVWRYEGGQEAVVCFGNRSPFDRSHFHSGRDASGPAGKKTAREQTYKYSIETPEGRIDPDVKVNP
jgi:hypothetical protein